MTPDQDKDDAQWLATLAGQKNTGADPVVQAQAEALRHALQAQSQRVDTRVPLADDAQYEQLLFRLRREGLTGHTNPVVRVVEWGRHQGQMAARAMVNHSALAWGVAACAVLVVGVALHLTRMPQGSDGPDMRQILRGQGTVLIVADPSARAAELVVGLKAAGEEPAIVVGEDGRVQLKFAASAAALDYLMTQRIEPQPVEGVVTLTLTAAPKKAD
jgi:hypothetical protein